MKKKLLIIAAATFMVLSCKTEKKTDSNKSVKDSVSKSSMTSAVKSITTAEEFDKLINLSGKISVVDMYADWCGPCKMLAPRLDELSLEYSTSNADVQFLKVNVDNLKELAMRYQVSSIPLVLMIKDGKVVNKVVGLREKKTYTELINSL